MDANISTMTMPKTMPAQNLLRYIGFEKAFSATNEKSCILDPTIFEIPQPN